MRLFVDTANLEDIRAAYDLGIVSGVTTNPVIILREDTHDVKGQIAKIRELGDGEILTQVLGRDSSEMVRQAKEIWSWDNNITVKLPANVEGIKAISELSKANIRTCATITYGPAQAIAAAVAGATYVALFVNRSKDMGRDGIAFVKTVAEIYKASNFETKILAASIDSPMDVIDMARIGVDVITAPYHTWADIIKNRDTDETLDSFLVNWTGKEI